MTGVSYSDASTPDVAFTYRQSGHRATMVDGTGTTSWAYDSLGRITSVTDGAGASLGYGYDRRGLITSIVYPNSSAVAQVWDDAGRLASITDWSGRNFTYSYDAAGGLVGLVWPDGVNETSFDYDNLGLLGGIELTDGTDPLVSLSYTYNDHNLLTAINQSGLPGVATLTYDYDLLDQLTTVNTGVDYAYDPADNLVATPLAATQAFDEAHQLCWISPTASTNGCDTAPVGATSFGYDTFGNRTGMTPDAGPATAYTYDRANRLIGVTGPVTATYVYNGDGLRMSKTVDAVTTSFVWDTLNAMPVILVEGDTYYLYGPDGLPLAHIDNQGAGDALYYHLDHQGSVRALTDETGEVVATYSYDPYGNPDGATGSIDQPLRYTGQYLDTETGLYHLRARYYDPTTGQFISVDPMLATTGEPYTYAGNNPTNLWDPLGLNKCEVGWNPLRWIGNAVDCVSKAKNVDYGKASSVVASVVSNVRRDFGSDLTDWSPRAVSGKAFGYSASAIAGIGCVMLGGNIVCLGVAYAAKRAGKAFGEWLWDELGGIKAWPPLPVIELNRVSPISASFLRCC